MFSLTSSCGSYLWRSSSSGPTFWFRRQMVLTEPFGLTSVLLGRPPCGISDLFSPISQLPLLGSWSWLSVFWILPLSHWTLHHTSLLFTEIDVGSVRPSNPLGDSKNSLLDKTCCWILDVRSVVVALEIVEGYCCFSTLCCSESSNLRCCFCGRLLFMKFICFKSQCMQIQSSWGPRHPSYAMTASGDFHSSSLRIFVVSASFCACKIVALSTWKASGVETVFPRGECHWQLVWAISSIC